VAGLQGVLPQVLDEAHLLAKLPDVAAYLRAHAAARLPDAWVLGQLLIQVLRHFVDSLDDQLGVQAQERSAVA